MEHDPNIFRDSSQVIQEVEDQLERILQKKFRDVDSDLVERINREKEAARLRKEEIEREFEKEKSALDDYRGMVRGFEEQRAGLLNEARDRFQKVLKFQAEIDALARSTVEEIKRVNEIQDKLETIRQQTSERAAFLKNDLRERFGIVAEVMDDEPVKPAGFDLDDELEKLRRIKDLLAMESAAANLGRLGGQSFADEDLARMDADARRAAPEIPGLQDLISGPAPAEKPAAPAPAVEAAPSAEPEPEPAPASAPEPVPAAEAAPAPEPEPSPRLPEGLTEEGLEAAIESYRRAEPADGLGEIDYFQKDGAAIADPEKLLAAVDRTIEEGQRLSLRLGQTESPKDQFFIKQELINWQEGLRALFLRVVKMCEKNAWVLPRFTESVVNPQVLRRLLERLSMENWSNLEEFSAFVGSVAEIRKAFQALTTPRLPYLLALRNEIEEG
ncbi:MAG TPA: hypothetical protein P5119_03730 [Candidatus Aminicenantes bacterium]|nr:hypothetical protein [Candidatus Aminicenantes bacterium]HRY64433.1 hypothetical protein [Candidatus Aminicenantes bacterium]HRZ71346.1 hypothetical protein [Candidatus Aminicenantes bacterium]